MTCNLNGQKGDQPCENRERTLLGKRTASKMTQRAVRLWGPEPSECGKGM